MRIRTRTSADGLLRGRTRLIRGSILGAACLLLTMAAHGAAGGAVVDLSLLPSAAIVIALGTVWAGRRATALRLAAFIGGVQLLLHVLSLVGGHAHTAGLVPTPGMLGAHAIAALAMAALLTRADAIAHAWHAFLTALARPIPALVPIPVHAAATPAPQLVTAPLLPLLSRDITRRGPPICE